MARRLGESVKQAIDLFRNCLRDALIAHGNPSTKEHGRDICDNGENSTRYTGP